MRKAIGAVCITVLCAALLTGCSNTAGSVSESLNEENSSLKYRCVKRDSKKGNGCLDCQSRNSCRVNFLACNCRATNKFKDKTVLIYLLNIYPSPIISDYLATKGYPLDADTYALAQLLQWIWRSAIREDKPVYLYLPSSRLRKLLYQYLNDED